MKVAILAGGLGTRLSEETQTIPKPLVEIGGLPIIWHIMMRYSHFGFNEFVIALGYKGELIKRWMLEYVNLNKDVTVETKNKSVIFHNNAKSCLPDLTVHLVDTGPETLTGDRVKRLAPWIGNEPFMLTYSDAVSNVDLDSLLKFHRSHGRLATVTAVRPPPRFGHIVIDGDRVTEFKEKAQSLEGWINGAFFVLEPEVFDYIEGDNTMFEKEPLERLVKENQLEAYRHEGFWQCMDTIHEKQVLEKMWQTGNPPWKTWVV
ncbi:glucose-1-phosphate cytidylyltransferase [Candidatus Bathyarchaeota archaeon]|nr:MAG: glucose-1-phosphate cytidylyltransferase [Candidatus Bathyarchaeota archaeon]